MNYLAHLHIADHTKTSFTGNFLGDFVKGDPEQQFPVDIVKGIRLHRYVDSFTDKHPLVLKAKQLFPKQLRRYAPIALDMFWDHCLARQWSDSHHLSLPRFCALAELKIADETSDRHIVLPERFQRVNGWVWKDKWLESYQKIENINYALQRMSMRSERMKPLAETGEVLIENYAVLSDVFTPLYKDLLLVTEQFVLQYKKGD